VILQIFQQLLRFLILPSETVVDYIEAYVTSSDEGGNFYKSISMMSLDGLKGI